MSGQLRRVPPKHDAMDRPHQAQRERRRPRVVLVAAQNSEEQIAFDHLLSGALEQLRVER